ncbi:leucyl aminopeptidase [Parvularcula marina]|uniref:Probable cytosol aminopeptidase n=1 Tax=Parvularcula marina TaxID=2292771 RepID=A0A371RG84_9PROT|nr:leucyl aminopeptidase [Parvularcula marina]RFB04450.1 leucyl aminopeptidase [Parvularcula marina]
MNISFSADLPDTGFILIPVLKDHLDSKILKDVDARTDGAVMRAARVAEFTGKPGEALTVPAPQGLADAIIVLLGLGDASDLTAKDAHGLGGKAAAQVIGKTTTAALLIDGLEIGGLKGEALAVAAGTGALLRNYDFDLYRKKTAKKDKKVLSSFAIIGSGLEKASEKMDAEKAVVEGVFFARDLVTEPPNVLHPESYAERCRELEKLGVKVTILDEADMAKLGMNTLLGVGQGSTKGSRLAVMEWKGGGDEAPLAFIGKGVTFDTGGISLKPGDGMWDMKFDMGGSAAVVGAMMALAGRKAKANVVGLVGLVENMPDGDAQRPADVVTSMSGQTVEVLNTDAEGRLVLADVLTYAQKFHKPRAMVDLATLTGAIIISLAHEYGGLFTKDDAFAESLLSSAKTAGEELWRMPLGKAHDEMIKSDIADMKNIGGREGGSSSAAAFLARFVEDDIPWAHLDIAGTAWATKDADVWPKGATGYGVRLLDQFVRDGYEG